MGRDDRRHDRGLLARHLRPQAGGGPEHALERVVDFGIGFFEPPPAPAEPEEEPEPQPEWIGPRPNYLGAAVPLRVVLARTDDVAVAITDATAYPTGFELTVAIRLRRPGHEHLYDFFSPHGARGGGGLDPEMLRFGLEFSDGRKVTNLASPPYSHPGEEPDAPVLIERGGRGGGGTWEQEFWVWPLPPEGPLAFVCEWPSEGIPVSRTEIDAGLVRAAAARAERLWDDTVTPGGGWTSF